VSHLYRIPGYIQGLPIGTDGPYRILRGELSSFSLPYQLSESPLAEESTRVTRQVILFPREEKLPFREAGDQNDDGIVVRPRLNKLRPVREGRGLSQSDPLELRGEILPELSGCTTSFLFEARQPEFPLLDKETQAEGQERDARKKDRREEEEDLSPV
jgi:hypothetical protein